MAARPFWRSAFSLKVLVQRVDAEELVQEAAGDAHHGRAAVLALRVQLEGLGLGVVVAHPRDARDVTGLGIANVRVALVLGEREERRLLAGAGLLHAAEEHDLQPARGGDRLERREQAGGRREALLGRDLGAGLDRDDLGLARSPALGVGPVPIALAEHDRVVQVVLEPRPADAAAAALQGLREALEAAAVQDRVLGPRTGRDILVFDEVVLLGSPVPNGMLGYPQVATLQQQHGGAREGGEGRPQRPAAREEREREAEGALRRRAGAEGARPAVRDVALRLHHRAARRRALVLEDALDALVAALDAAGLDVVRAGRATRAQVLRLLAGLGIDIALREVRVASHSPDRLDAIVVGVPRLCLIPRLDPHAGKVVRVVCNRMLLLLVNNRRDLLRNTLRRRRKADIIIHDSLAERHSTCDSVIVLADVLLVW